MDIFISHSWKNKTLADKLAGDLEGVGNIWIDHQQTKPGERISADIKKGLDTADIMILIWSRDAASSKWVKQEIDYALNADPTIIPCLVDDKTLPRKLKHTLSIPFGDYTEGFARLNIVFLKHNASELGLDFGDLGDKFDDWDGVIDIINNYRKKKDISGDAAYWIDRVLQATNAAHTGGTAFLEEFEESANFIQSLTDRLEAVKDDREGLRELLYEIIRNENIAPPIMQKMRVMIEQMIDQLPPKSKRRPRQRSSDPSPKSIRSIRGTKPAQAPKSPRAQLRSHLRGRVPANELNEIVEYLMYYNETANAVLNILSGIAQQRASTAGTIVVQSLFQYLQNPDDLLPESSYGYFGYIDDGWLIHNTAWRLIEAGMIAPQIFGVDWNRLQIADGLVRQLLPSNVLSQLENMLMQYLMIIAEEIQTYQPQFAPGAGTYHPQMGGRSTEDRWHDVLKDSLNYL